MPSAFTLGVIFILVTPSSTWLWVYTLVFAVGLSELAPTAAMTYQGVIIGMSLLTGSVLGPILSDLADKKRDYRPSLTVIATLTVIGDIGLLAAAKLGSLPLFVGAAMLIASSNCTVVPVGNALSGTYAAADPERAGLIAALMLGAITVMPLVGNVSLGLCEFSLDDPRLLYILGPVHAGCLTAILALPSRFLRPHALLDLVPAEEQSTLRVVCAFFSSIVEWFVKAEYRAFLLVAAGMNFAYTPIQSSFSMLPYMLEDMGELPSQRAIQDFVALWMSTG